MYSALKRDNRLDILESERISLYFEEHCGEDPCKDAEEVEKIAEAKLCSPEEHRRTGDS